MAFRPSGDLIPRVVTGFELAFDLTLGIARGAPARAPCGFHRFEPVVKNSVATAPGNVIYPTRNFATLGILLA
jgi:hypothetical protein